MADSIIDITKILNDYSIDIQNAITEDAINISKNGVNELKNTSPRGSTGKYKRGWRVKTIKGNGFVDCTIYNTEYRLTHLLEKPHAIKNQYGSWGTSTPKVHIKPVEQKCNDEFERDVKRIIQNGG